MLILLAVGTIASLVTGVWQLGRAEALAAFFLYQAALGVADLITIGLRSGRHRQAATLRTTCLWVGALVGAVFGPSPWWELAALAAATALAIVHRPDMALFAAATLPVSLALVLAALLRNAPFPWTFLILAIVMGALFWWQRRRGRTADAP